MNKSIDTRKNTGIILILCLFIVAFICGITTGLSRKNRESTIDKNMIYENTISPNEEFIDNEEDKVFYTIKIYQDNNIIRVVTSSNSSFTKDISYEIKCENKITKDDINVEWQTIMGDTNYTKENQLVVAVISISSNKEVISTRKVNFISKAIDIIKEVL